MKKSPPLNRFSAAAAAMAAPLLALLIILGNWDPSRLTGGDDGLGVVAKVILSISIFVSILAAPVGRGGAIKRIFYYLPILLLLCLMALSALWTRSGDAQYFTDKIRNIFFLACIVIFTASLVRREPDARSFCLAMLVGFGVITLAGAVAFLLNSSAGDISRATALGGGPNVFARIASYTTIFAIVLLLPMRRLLATVLMGAGLVGVAAAGSRGAYIGTVAVVVLLILEIATGQIQVGRALKAVRRAAPFVVLGVFAIVVSPIFTYALGMFRYRFLMLTLESRYTSGRAEIFEEAGHIISQTPIFGRGLASFELWPDLYAHNIFLEVWSESGILALIFLLLSLLIFFRAAFRKVVSPVFRACRYAFVFSITSAQFSGDIYDSRYLFVFGIVMTALTRTRAPRVTVGLRNSLSNVRRSGPAGNLPHESER